MLLWSAEAAHLQKTFQILRQQSCSNALVAERHATKDGFHKELYTKGTPFFKHKMLMHHVSVTLKDQRDCDFGIFDNLTSSAFVDMYQIQNGLHRPSAMNVWISPENISLEWPSSLSEALFV